MCGIAGAVGWIDEGLVHSIEVMNRAQEHRGPDDHGIWSSRDGAASAGAVLGHRRLSIVDLSSQGHQPMVDPATGCVIAFNGEVYNFRELRARLEADGHTFVSSTDTEVVLRAYTVWGIDFVTELRGMFALAIWDPRSAQVLLARDRLGIKPLYLARTQAADGSTALMFASELRALLGTGRFDRKIDPIGLASYLWNGVVIGPNTIIEGISLLPAACTLTVSSGDPSGTQRRYWSIPRDSAPRPDAKERVENALVESIQMRLVADVPLGVFLSGGVDSSAVAAVAARVSEPGSVRTFNVSFDEAEFDESHHARTVAEKLGTQHQEIRLTEDSFKKGLDAALRSLDQPTFDAINTYFISRAVREAGLTVAIAGTGGDEIFGGYPSFADLPRARSVARVASRVPAALRSPVARAITRIRTGAPGAIPPQTRWGKLDDLLSAGGDLASLYQVSYGLFTRDFLESLGAGLAGVDHGIPGSRMAELRELIAGESSLSAISMLELSLFLGERLLRDTDCASMATSLEVRVPIIDHVVLEAVAELDPAGRFGTLGKKQILRDLARPDLDPSLFDRPKAGFELPIDVWSRDGIRDDMESLFGDAASVRRVGLDPATVIRMWRAYLDGAPGLYWTRLWSIYVLLRWTREHDAAL